MSGKLRKVVLSLVIALGVVGAATGWFLVLLRLGQSWWGLPWALWPLVAMVAAAVYDIRYRKVQP